MNISEGTDELHDISQDVHWAVLVKAESKQWEKRYWALSWERTRTEGEIQAAVGAGVRAELEPMPSADATVKHIDFFYKCDDAAALVFCAADICYG